MSNTPTTGNSYNFNSPDLSFSHQSSFTIPPGANAATIRDLQMADLAKTEKFFGDMGDKLRALQQQRPLTEGEQAGLAQADAWRNQVRGEQQALRDEAALAACDQPSRHIANATAWRAICTDPDWCKVGNSVVAFDSFAVIDQVQIASPNVKAQCEPVYRIGDLHKGIQADAGAQLIAQTSLGSGYTKMLSGSNSVKVNNLPVARDGSECLVNCNIMGVGGAKGKIVTETKGGGNSAPPSRASNPDAPPGQRTSERLEQLKRREAELKKGLINVDAADEYVRFDDLNKLIDQYVQGAPELGLYGDFQAQVRRGLLKAVTGFGEGIYELGKLGVEGLQRQYLPGGSELSIVQGQILSENIALGNVTASSVGSAAGRIAAAVVVPPSAQQAWGKGNYVEAITNTGANLATFGAGALKGGAAARGAKAAGGAVDDLARASATAADDVAGKGVAVAAEGSDDVAKAAGKVDDGVHIKPPRIEVRNGYTYTMDELGRVTKVEGNLKMNKAQGRNSQAQLEAGGPDRLSSDQGGHYIGRRFDGPTDDFNHFAQNGNFNNSAYKKLENSWQRALESGQSVRVEIIPNYAGNSLRPTSLTINQWLDNVAQDTITLRNVAGGG